MYSFMRTMALLAASGLAPDALAQTSGATFEASADAAVRRAADSLELSESQRSVFYENVDTAVADGFIVNPAAGRPMVDSALAQVVRETGRKIRFVRHARVLFGEMYARRANDSEPPPGTEEELWRSPVNVARLIELYRENPEAGDHEIQRAMAAAFRKP